MPASKKASVYTVKEHVAYVTLNRPGIMNVINQELAQDLIGVCQQISQDDNVYVVVITGAGRTFCSGSEFEQELKAKSASRLAPIPNVASAIAGIDRPVIVAINGDALGQGLEIALAGDIRLAASEASFAFTQVANGLIPMDGGTQRLSRIVGRGKTLELILSSEKISAEEALAIGLVSQVLPPSELMAAAESLAQSMAGKAPIALRYIKEAVNKGLDLTLEQGLHLEADLYFLLHTTADRTEGIPRLP